jgi:hypothetical protein
MFMDDFQNYITELKATIPNLVICEIITFVMKPLTYMILFEIKKVSGFTRERAWLDTFKKMVLSIVSFLNKEPDNYSWWTMRVPQRESDNKGWRIDYCLVRAVERSNKRALILPEAKHSDHCPVLVEVEKVKIDNNPNLNYKDDKENALGLLIMALSTSCVSKKIYTDLENKYTDLKKGKQKFIRRKLGTYESQKSIRTRSGCVKK